MNEEETSLRKELRGIRRLATSLGRTITGDEALYAMAPEYQAEAIIEGRGYTTASILLVTKLLATGELQLKDEVCPDCGYVITKEEQREEKVEMAERILKEKFDPVAVTREVTMPLIKWCLESVECYMVEQGYRLPKWQRPKWLQEMETGGQKE